MSRAYFSETEKADFIQRFVEMCGTSEPAKIERDFGISYQAAKNYLQGRVPNAEKLLSLSRQTGYSIHWLLAGTGHKFVDTGERQDTLLLTDQIETIVRMVCVEVLNRLEPKPAQQGSVKLQPADILSEKVWESTSSNRKL